MSVNPEIPGPFSSDPFAPFDTFPSDGSSATQSPIDWEQLADHLFEVIDQAPTPFEFGHTDLTLGTPTGGADGPGFALIEGPGNPAGDNPVAATVSADASANGPGGADPLFDPMYQKPSGTPGGGGHGGGGGGGGGPAPSDGPTQAWFSYTSGAADANGIDHYNITVEFYGLESDWASPSMGGADTTNWFIAAFTAAADYLSSVISDGLPDDTYPGSYFDGTQESRHADDIVIEAYMTTIDGAGGVLGQSGPTYARDYDGDNIIDGLPTAGIMQFDVADAAVLLTGGEIVPGTTIDGGVWFDTVLHEMMHVLGFGTLWGVTEESPDFNWDLVGSTLTLDSDMGTRRPGDDEYHYDYLGDANLVAGETLGVEANGGSGTAGGHWDELLYGNELMTGYINTDMDPTVDSSTATDVGSYNHVADFTVAALADLGYTVDDTRTYQELANLGNDVLMLDDAWGMIA